MTIALILAAGEAKRFNLGCKQLLNLNEETVIERIIRQVHSRGYVPMTVTHKEELKQISQNHFHPKNHSVTCETLLSTIPMWSERTVVLLGDVIYSASVMDSIFNEKSPIRVWGNTFEIFAISFTKETWPRVIDCLQIAKKHRLGKLRYFYRAYIKQPLDCKEIEGKPLDGKVFCYIGWEDYTGDIDTPLEYSNFINQVIKTNRLDDLKK